MVIGLLILTAIPTVTGVAQAVSAQRSKEEREKDERRMKKFYIDVHYEGDVAHGRDLNNGRIVLKDNCVWIGPPGIESEGDPGYVAQAFYIEYPDPERIPAPMGLVSQVQNNPPLLNWIYVDKDTMEIKYGNRSRSIDHFIGPWDWSDDEKQVVFDDMEAAYINAFYAVQKSNGRWQLYFDMSGKSLVDHVPNSLKKLQVQLHRALLPDGESAMKK